MIEQIADLIGRQNVDIAMVVITLVSFAFVYVFCCWVYLRENQPMANEQKVILSSRGVGFFGLLFVVLFVLKLGVAETAVVGWSWWWVTAPLWAPTCLAFGLIVAFLVVMLVIVVGGLGIVAITSYCEKRKARKEAEAKE